METNFSPTIITSQAAENHLTDIKSQHADIVQGMKDQSVRVAQFNADQEARKTIEAQQKATASADTQKAQMDAQTKQLEEQNKAKELAIKEAALSL